MRTVGLIAAALLASLLTLSMAQSDYPTRFIQIIVPFTAGGGNDLLARALADKLQKRWSQTVIVENKPGAGGNIGTEAMRRAPSDGYTLLLATNSMTIPPHLNKATPYNVRTDFAPLAKLSTTPFVLVVQPEKLSVRTVAELVRHIKANPGKLTYASVGVGTPHHLGDGDVQGRDGVGHDPYPVPRIGARAQRYGGGPHAAHVRDGERPLGYARKRPAQGADHG
jgi:tripartite-type tricarboxylate transporter receptor subunit TctC